MSHYKLTIKNKVQRNAENVYLTYCLKCKSEIEKRVNYVPYNSYILFHGNSRVDVYDKFGNIKNGYDGHIRCICHPDILVVESKGDAYVDDIGYTRSSVNIQYIDIHEHTIIDVVLNARFAEWIENVAVEYEPRGRLNLSNNRWYSDTQIITFRSAEKKDNTEYESEIANLKNKLNETKSELVEAKNEISTLIARKVETHEKLSKMKELLVILEDQSLVRMFKG